MKAYLVGSHDLRNVGDTVRLLALVKLRLQLINTNANRCHASLR